MKRLDFKHVVNNRKFKITFLEGVNKVTKFCLADMLYTVYSLGGICSVV